MRIRYNKTKISVKNKQRQAYNGMAIVPAPLKPTQRLVYPQDNAIPFERWYLNSYSDIDARERIYLPIQWTALYCNNNFGKCSNTYRMIQTVINGLDKTKKYYTIVQYDDGILNDLTGIDIKVFAMSGPRIDYALPLLCTPHGFKFNCERDIFASFIGRETHPIRTAMIKQLQDKQGYYISTKAHKLRDYCEILARSKYALCPRGYGKSSFRIQEAIEYGAVPVYISDEFVLPYNHPVFSFGLQVPSEIDNIDGLIRQCDNNYGLLKMIIDRNKNMFTYNGCKAEILYELSNDAINIRKLNENSLP